MNVQLENLLREITDKTTMNDQFPVLTSSKDGLFLQSDYFNKKVASRDNTGYKIIRRGQFTYRAMSDTGEFFPNMLECIDIGIVSPAYPVFEIAKTDIILPEYLQFFFKSDAFQYSISSFAQGSTRTSVKFSKIQSVQLSLPSIEKQKFIIEALKKAQNLLEIRKKSLSACDTLIKARFVEMFENQKYPIMSVNDVIIPGAGLSYGIIVPGDYYEDGCPMVRPSDYQNGKLDLSNVYKVKPEIEAKYTRTRLQGNEILVQVIGQPGQIILATKECQGMNVTRNLAVIRPNSEIVDRIYLTEYMRTVKAQIYLTGSAKQSTLKQLPLGLLKSLEIPIPPLEQQHLFASFVSQIDKSKSLIQSALAKDQLLFDSLMQKYFG